MTGEQSAQELAAEPENNRTPQGQFAPGVSGNPAGRAKGTPNKTTQLLKDAILMAAQQAGGEGGMVAYLKDQAEKNPGPFMGLLGKVLPMTVAGDKDNPLQTITRIELVAPSPNVNSQA